VELDFRIFDDTANRHEDSRDIFVGSDRQLELLTFPEGEDDAVTITTSDLEGLQPARFLSNNVIDFYIK
jgi:Ulp1 family protease